MSRIVCIGLLLLLLADAGKCPAGKYGRFTFGRPPSADQLKNVPTLVMQCKGCVAGFYQDEAGRTTCKACPKGKWSPIAGGMDCLQATPAPSTAPSRAPTYSPTTAAPSTVPTPTPTTHPTNKCAEGHFLPCTPQINAPKASSLVCRWHFPCVKCPKGKYSPSFSDSCLLCAPGRFGTKHGEGKIHCLGICPQVLLKFVVVQVFVV